MPQGKKKNTVFDTGRQRVGLVYAKALVGATEKAGQTEQVLDELASIVDVLDELPDFDEALRTPRIESAEKSQMLERTLGSRVSPLTMNFLKVVASHERLDCLRAIERSAQKLVNEMRNRVEVLVQTAAPISNNLRSSIVAKLGQMLGREVVLTTSLNPDLLGGLVVRVGDTVYDGSLAGKLKTMQAVALEQTTTKIRESLERFALT